MERDQVGRDQAGQRAWRTRREWTVRELRAEKSLGPEGRRGRELKNG